MAVKKVSAKTEETKKEVEVSVETAGVDVETEVEAGVAPENETDVVETDVETDLEVEETTEEVEVDVPEVEIEEPKTEEVVVDSTPVDTAKKPKGSVKIRMRVDHKCCIAMERYDLKAGKTYVVPENVKRILNKAGLLAPL